MKRKKPFIFKGIGFKLDAVILLTKYNHLTAEELGSLILYTLHRIKSGFTSKLPEFVLRTNKTHDLRRYISTHIRKDVLSSGECLFCKSENNLTVDHIIPISKGGTNVRSNLQCLCFKCNLKKSDKYG